MSIPFYEYADLDKVEHRRRAFIIKYGPHDVAEDLRVVLDEVFSYRRKENDYGFLTEDARLQLAALKHLCTRVHKFEPLKCSECHQAKKVMDAIRGKEI